MRNARCKLRVFSLANTESLFPRHSRTTGQLPASVLVCSVLAGSQRGDRRNGGGLQLTHKRNASRPQVLGSSARTHADADARL